MDEANLVPIYYILGSDLTEAQIEFVLHSCRITPIEAVIITSDNDKELALRFSDTVYKTSFNYAHRFATELGQPVIIFAGQGFHAYYADGHSEEISTQDRFKE